MFDLVIFDNDGVLVDSERLANAILAALLTEAGVPTTYEDSIGEFMGASLARVRQVVEGRLGQPLPSDLEHRYHTQLFARFRSDLQPVQDVVWALDRIHGSTCVASSGSMERIRVSLELTGLLHRFEGRIFSAEQVACGKPAPDLFLYVASQLGASPSRCAVVEDSPLGVTAANAAGMMSFGFAGMGHAERLRHASGGVFTSMRDLPRLLSGDR